MSDTATITTEVDATTFQAVTSMAAVRGVSPEQLAGEMIRQMVADEAELLGAIEEGRRQIAAGEYVTHGELVEQIRRWKRDRKRAA